MNVEQIAKTCQEVNKVFCEHLGDYSQPKWDNAPDWQRETLIDGVKFHQNNPDSKPEDSHNNWMAKKVKDGWVYGEEKDVADKTHPCLVKFDELPVDQQTKDCLFIAVVRSFE